MTSRTGSGAPYALWIRAISTGPALTSTRILSGWEGQTHAHRLQNVVILKRNTHLVRFNVTLSCLIAKMKYLKKIVLFYQLWNYFQRKLQLLLIVRLHKGDQLLSSLISALHDLPWFVHVSSTHTDTNHSLLLSLVYNQSPHADLENSTPAFYRTLDLIGRLCNEHMTITYFYCWFYRCKIIEINLIKSFVFIYMWQLIIWLANTDRTNMMIISIIQGFWTIYQVSATLDTSIEVGYEITRNHLIEIR